MQVDALSLRLRPRTPYEAADLGVRLCHSAARDVYRCHLAVAVPALGLALATMEISAWLPGLVMWWMKPWLDRTILFVLSRSAFGQPTTLGDLWRAQGSVLWSQLFSTLTWRRLSPWRSFTQPVYQLEGVPFWRSRKRVLQIRRRRAVPAVLLTSAYSLCETCLVLAAFSLLAWFAPQGQMPDLFGTLTGDEVSLGTIYVACAYALVVMFLEPFYVASGFAMYLSRRAELEAWDIEQEFRRAFSR